MEQTTLEIWTFKNNIFDISKIFKYHKFQFMSAFHMWMVGYHHLIFFLIQISLLKEFLA